MPRYLPNKTAVRGAFAVAYLLAVAPAAAADLDAVARGAYLAV